MLKRQIQRLGLDKKLKAIYEKYERIFIPTFLIVGFVFDIITFRALQVKSNLELQLGYVILAALALSYSHMYDARPQPPAWRIWGYLRFAAPFAEQIAFGSLLSSALLFYWFSGSFSVSWPLFAITVGLMISSEVFRHVYLRPGVQLALYNFVLLAYFAVLLPFAFRSLSSWLFLMSGFLSTLLVTLLALFLSKHVPRIRREESRILVGILSVFILMSSFYFLNLIPPVPLAIRDAGIYHDIIRQDHEYTLVGEDETFLQKLLPGQTIHAGPHESIYAYTAIFAPADSKTIIYHRWQYKDPETGKWVDQSLLHFTIIGGRQQGYRGYSLKTGLAPGRWRVTVQNARGQVLGRLTFVVVRP